MRFVLYSSKDMEPITVLEVRGVMRLAEQQSWHFHLAYFAPPVMPRRLNEPIENVCRSCHCWIEWIQRRGEFYPMFFTDDEETALLLRAAFLPGQHGELQARTRESFAAGFMTALLKGGFIDPNG